MIYLLLAVSWLLFYAAIGHLSRKLSVLRAEVSSLYKRHQKLGLDLFDWGGTVTEIGRQVYDPDPKHNQGTSTPEPLWKRLADVERLASSHESACELNSAGLEAQTTLSILHAETVTRLQSRVDKLAHDPHYQRPTRRDKN